MSRHWARGKFGEHERGKNCSKSIRVQLRPPEYSPNFPSAQYLDISTAEAWTHNIIKNISAAVTLNVYYYNTCEKQNASKWLRDYIFLQHSYVFVLKVRESLTKLLKIAVKKIVKSILRVRKTIVIHQKILFERNNFAKNDLHTP